MKHRAMRRRRYRNPARLEWMAMLAREADDQAAAHRLYKAAVRMGYARSVGELALSFDSDWAGRDPARARQLYHRALLVDPSYVPAYNLALLYREQGLPKAHRRYVKLALHRGDNDAALDLARLALADGDAETAKHLLRHCLSCTSCVDITADSQEEAAQLVRQIEGE